MFFFIYLVLCEISCVFIKFVCAYNNIQNFSPEHYIFYLNYNIILENEDKEKEEKRPESRLDKIKVGNTANKSYFCTVL